MTILTKSLLTIAGSMALLLGCSSTASAQDDKPALKYVDAQELRIINKGWEDTGRKYGRIPTYLQDSVRDVLWERSQCSSGIAVRFATNSSRIGVKYQLLWNTHMLHMADTGLKGTDLYILEGDSVWRHVNTNRPNADKNKMCEKIYVENMDEGMREYMIYMPLYDGVEDLWVAVDSNAIITPGNYNIIDSNKKIIAYGTSILQGGCASRSGMAATNIISRALNCEVVNIGISGEGKMDYCMARAMAQIPDADVFLIDPIPNCTEMMCDTLTYDFINIIRKARPDIPIVMVEGPIYPYARYDKSLGAYLPRKNEAFRRNYEKLMAENPNNLYYVDCVNLDGVEDDGTVDGIHLTDLGFKYYAEKLIPVLQPLIEKAK